MTIVSSEPGHWYAQPTKITRFFCIPFSTIPQEISASHPVRAGQPMTITATISPVNWLDQQQIAFNVQFWVKPSPTSTWTPLPIAQTLEDQNQVQWTPPTSTGWAIGATLSPNATGPVIGQAVTTASLWDDWVQAQHHLANVLTPNTFRTYSVPYTAALTTLAQQYHFTQNTVIGQSTAVTTLTQQAQSLGLTLPSSVWAAGLTVATQDIPVYINNPALALKQMDWGLMPSAWQQTEVTNLMEGENIYTQMNDWRFLLQMTLESSVPSSAVIPAPSSSSLELLLSKTANGVVELNVPMQVVAWGYGPSTANASLLTTGQFAPMDVDLTLALVPDVAAPSGWGWIPVSYEG
ncbi:hypothetical protein [Sulfobacillus thermotolerans]|uniref:hypothetical protein n=1 Tax=Sulfobacillus thermotolerans TaxID=338644 RepID=UPI0033671048